MESLLQCSQKYGVVPQEVMPETAHSNNTSQMVNLINEKFRLARLYPTEKSPYKVKKRKN
ncbi:MAG: C1 family peptidase [Odoribacter sp.]